MAWIFQTSNLNADPMTEAISHRARSARLLRHSLAGEYRPQTCTGCKLQAVLLGSKLGPVASGAHCHCPLPLPFPLPTECRTRRMQSFIGDFDYSTSLLSPISAGREGEREDRKNKGTIRRFTAALFIQILARLEIGDALTYD